MSWTAQIIGEEGDLALLASQLRAKPLAVVRREDGYFVLSDRFDALTDPKVVVNEVDHVVTVLRGLLALTKHSITKLKVTQIFHLDADGNRDTTIIDVAKSITVRVVGDETVTFYGSLAVFALQDENVSKAQRLLAIASDWGGLYRIFELIRHDAGGESKIAQHGWATVAQLEAFRRTAHSPSAGGLSARHAVEATTPPSKPMAFEDARPFLEQLLRSWIKSRHKKAT